MRSLSFILTIMMAVGAMAAVPQRVQQTAGALKQAPAVEVIFTVNGHEGSMSMSAGGMFSIDLGDAKVFYDGTTQWSYSRADNEVTVFKPTADEIAEANPAAILMTLGSDFNGRKVSDTKFRLTPAQPRNDLAEVNLTYPAQGKWPTAITFVTANGTLELSNMKFKTLQTKKPTSAFQFKIPKGTTITKL